MQSPVPAEFRALSKGSLRTILQALLACSLLSGCLTSHYKSIPLGESAFPVELKDGQKRLVGRIFSTTGTRYRAVSPSLLFIEVAKDTTAGGVTGKLVRTTSYEFDSVPWSHSWRQLVAVEEGRVSVYDFKDSAIAFAHGLLKRSAWDTSVYLDRQTFAFFPLTAGLRWNIRDTAQSLHIEGLDREYVGKEVLEWDGRRRECLVFREHFSAEDVGKYWIAPQGLLKADLTYGRPVEAVDTAGNVLDLMRSGESFELLDIDPSEAVVAARKEEYRKRYVSVMP